MSNKHNDPKNESVIPGVVPLAEVSAPAVDTEEARTNRLVAATVSASVKALMAEALPGIMAAVIQANNAPTANEASALAAAQAKIARREICQVCKQAKVGCGGKHVKAIVYPMKYPEYGKWFQGCIINGIRYLSDNRNDYVTIPENCVGPIMKQVADYEENERATRNGRVAEHDSGGINQGGGGSVRPPSQAWR